MSSPFCLERKETRIALEVCPRSRQATLRCVGVMSAVDLHERAIKELVERMAFERPTHIEVHLGEVVSFDSSLLYLLDAIRRHTVGIESKLALVKPAPNATYAQRSLRVFLKGYPDLFHKFGITLN